MPSRQQKESKLRQLINDMSEENEYKNLMQNRDRARSVTVGTCGGGSLELHMRGDYHSSWMLLTPVEALELAEQLAAASGVHVAMKPKNDFSAWRGWNADNVDYDHIHLLGQSPHVAKHLALKDEAERAKLPFEPNNPENRERIEEFMEQKEENLADAASISNEFMQKTHQQYANEENTPAKVAPKFETRKPRDSNKIHEFFEDGVDEQVDGTIARLERDKKNRDEYRANERELLRKSFLERDKKRAAKAKAEAKSK